MGSLQYPYLFRKHHLMILFLNLLFQCAPLHRSHADLVFLQKYVSVYVKTPSTYYDFALFLGDVPLVSRPAHPDAHDEMRCHGVYLDSSNDFLTCGASLPYVWIYVAYCSVVSDCVFF